MLKFDFNTFEIDGVVGYIDYDIQHADTTPVETARYFCTIVTTKHVELFKLELQQINSKAEFYNNKFVIDYGDPLWDLISGEHHKHARRVWLKRSKSFQTDGCEEDLVKKAKIQYDKIKKFYNKTRS